MVSRSEIGGCEKVAVLSLSSAEVKRYMAGTCCMTGGRVSNGLRCFRWVRALDAAAISSSAADY
jgi:hypothetical protein